ncbi:MAG: DUF2061 domain-containing protein [Flavobacteriaceae bacterium]|nr:DUF2061 domain-containing protein [Flavobacteriaceae bacterium]
MENTNIISSRKRHILKSITWRVLASTTTFIIAFLFFKDDPYATEKATGVAVTESIIKMALYYFHERAWYKSNFGLITRKSRVNVEE